MRAESLLRDEVHLWTIERDRGADVALLSECLSLAERQRARRLRVKQRRESFIYNRALARHILASYAGLTPQRVPLTTSPGGKPLWDSSSADASDSLSFNLSHRGDLAILAISRNRAVGVDLEVVDASNDHDAIASQALSPRELALYGQLPPEQRPPAVLRTWTCKEAFLKALGVGLSRPLAQLEVTFSISEPVRLLATGSEQESPVDWLLESWSPRAGWFAALATPREGGALHLRFHRATSLQDWYPSPHDRGTLGWPEHEEHQHVA
jgi:4'-phosphopantetheinyl transferase